MCSMKTNCKVTDNKDKIKLLCINANQKVASLVLKSNIPMWKMVHDKEKTIQTSKERKVNYVQNSLDLNSLQSIRLENGLELKH